MGQQLNIIPEVPFSLADINAEWLTDALRSGGVLDSAAVTDFSHRIIGEETGFLGEVAILNLNYSEPVDAPSTLVLKIPTALKNRVMGQTLGVYEKEIRFYSSLRSQIKVRSPEHYYSAMSAVDEPAVVLKRLENLNRLPTPVIAILALVARFVFGLMPRKYVLLIEDVSRYRLGDQSRQCSDADINAALSAMATLHAQYWESRELENMTWIAPVIHTAKLVQMVYLQSVNKYLKGSGDALNARQKSLITWLKEHGIQLTEVLGESPKTLLHGDFRLDNLCFDDESGEAMLLDWQTMTSGSAGMDLAYFLSAAMPLTASDQDVDDAIAFYRQALAQQGVTIGFDEIKWLYEVGMLAMLHRIAPILFQEQLELGTDRGPEIMRNWIEKTYRRLESIDFENILDRRPRA